MRLHIATDHAGFEFKEELLAHLTAAGHDVVDHGASAYDAQDDYPSFCFSAAQAVVAEPGSLGIVIGGSGNGEQIAANRVRGIRAALGYKPEIAILARQHNDANVLGIGARMHTTEEAFEIVDAFVATPFSGDPRHQRRIDEVSDFEAARDAS